MNPAEVRRSPPLDLFRQQLLVQGQIAVARESGKWFQYRRISYDFAELPRDWSPPVFVRDHSAGDLSIRGMMMALGCIQALKCNSHHCPVGVATTDPELFVGLVPSHKSVRVANFHRETVKSLAEMLGAIGLDKPSDLRPWHVLHRTSPTETKHYGEL